MRFTVLAALVLATAVPASARTYVFPHFLEKPGFITGTPYTFDTNLFMAYTAGLAGTDAGFGGHFDTYLFEADGSPTTNGGATICNPCSFDLGFVRKTGFRIESQMLKGGLLDAPVRTGYAIVNTNDGDNASVMGNIFNSHTSSSDLATITLTPWTIEPHGISVFALPHFFETSGNTETATNAFDNTLFAAYVGGQAGVAGGGGAALDLYLYTDDGAAMKNNGNDVCAPCTYNFGGALPRKDTIKLQDVILAQGAFDASAKSGFAMLVVRGVDPDGLALWGMSVNSHTGPNDVTMTELPLTRLPITLTLAAPADGGFVRALAAQPNPSRGGVAFTFELARAADVTFAIYDALGRKVRTVAAGPLAAGAQRANWDGKDDGGGQVAPGVYFSKLVSGSDVQASKLVVLP